ncbi:MAG: TIGR02646 family protein [Gammaproteobacteria bacterium]|nr:MAG: TIGR02646 family protein [Gammaproteobacteria bacterium]
MKSIKKGNEPKELMEWKQKGFTKFKSLRRSKVKSEVKNALMEEQGYICCYCEQELIATDSHIEHFLPQDSYPEKALDFSNMLCSCQDQIKKGEPRHCGNLKGNNEISISPLDEDCESFFKYTYDGYIEPVDENARITIEKLGLDITKLNALRRDAIEPFIDDSLTEDELMEFVSAYLKKVDGKYQLFYTTIKFLFLKNTE